MSCILVVVVVRIEGLLVQCVPSVYQLLVPTLVLYHNGSCVLVVVVVRIESLLARRVPSLYQLLVPTLALNYNGSCILVGVRIKGPLVRCGPSL